MLVASRVRGCADTQPLFSFHKKAILYKRKEAVMSKKKKYILIAIFIVLTACVMSIVIRNMKYINGTEWYAKQDGYMTEFETYAGEMDDVVSLYLSGSIGEADFLTHVSILQGELTLMKADYDQYRKRHPVRTGSMTYYEKMACDAVESIFPVFQNMLDMMRDNSANPAQLSYEYIAFHQDIIKCVAKYATAQAFIDGKFQETQGPVEKGETK